MKGKQSTRCCVFGDITCCKYSGISTSEVFMITLCLQKSNDVSPYYIIIDQIDIKLPCVVLRGSEYQGDCKKSEDTG